jgi:predicted nucleic acid-binding protein
LTTPLALLDSNVVIAMLAEAHEHHEASIALMDQVPLARLAVAAHSYAEVFVTLTRRGDAAPFRYAASHAIAALESLRAATALVGLTPAQGFDTTRRFAHAGGIGARLYDALIGEVARIGGIGTIITWNTRHMGGLFPDLAVVTPRRFRAK